MSVEKKGLGGIFHNFNNLLEKLNELASSKNGEHQWETGESGEKKELKGVYGFSIKFGLGGSAPKVDTFGNFHRDESEGYSVDHENREPVVDVFEEKEHILVVAEMPGVCEKDLEIEVQDDILTIKAQKGERKYSKEVLLPQAVRKDGFSVACNNGVVELKFLRDVEKE